MVYPKPYDRLMRFSFAWYTSLLEKQRSEYDKHTGFFDREKQVRVGVVGTISACHVHAPCRVRFPNMECVCVFVLFKAIYG